MNHLKMYLHFTIWDFPVFSWFTGGYLLFFLNVLPGATKTTVAINALGPAQTP